MAPVYGVQLGPRGTFLEPVGERQVVFLLLGRPTCAGWVCLEPAGFEPEPAQWEDETLFGTCTYVYNISRKVA